MSLRLGIAAASHLLAHPLRRLARAADGVRGSILDAHAPPRGSRKAARAQGDRLVLPADALHEGLALWGPDDRLVLCNRRFRSLFAGLGERLEAGLAFSAFAELVAARLTSVAEPERAAWVQARLASHRGGDGAQEFELPGVGWLRVSEARLPDGGTVGIYADVSSAKARELALQESERRLRTIVDSAGEGIVVLDARGSIETVNAMAVAIFGRPTEAFPGLGLSTLLRAGTEEGQDEAAATAALLAKVDAGPVETTGLRADGGMFPAELLLRPLNRPGRAAYLATVRDVTAQKAARDTILFQATHDPLTGLPNRRLFDDRLEQALAQARRSGKPLAVAFLDLDRFKAINDSLGHAAGDALLVTVSRRLRACLREADTVARLGGDEFILILPELRAGSDAARPARKLLESLRAPIRLQGQELTVTASIGLAVFPEDGIDAAMLLKHADAALYRAKACGRDRFELFDRSSNLQATARATLEAELRRACGTDQLRLVYQPQIDVATGRLVGFEALMRWQHPERGAIAPDIFIPLAEESGLISTLGAWALHAACRDMAAWCRAARSPLRLAVNVSSRQLREDALAGQVEEALAAAGLPPARLELEIKEAVLLEEDDLVSQRLDELRRRGVGLALDDFGTGYASLSHLRQYPIQRLKMDRSFLRDVTRNAGDAALVRAVITLAQEVGLAVVAEGIETGEQLDLLRSFGCREGQGYFIGHPLAAQEVPRRLAEAA